MKKFGNEKGAALILALVLVFVLSVLGVSLLFVSQTETWGSMNYRLLTQARYGAEAGLNQAAAYLANTYAPPPAGTDALSNYVITSSPVTYNSNPVYLSGNSSITANYPVSSVKDAFSSKASGSLTAGNTTINYAAYAQLLSMRQLQVYGSTTPVTVQIWRITSDGTISGIRNASVQVSAVIEKQYGPAFNYAVFATATGCSSLSWGGSSAATTDSYDSANLTYDSHGNLVTQTYGGNVGTNGNLSEVGSATVHGSLSTPRAGVGACTASSVTALTGSLSGVSGGLIQLPQGITYPNPTIPPPGATNETFHGSGSTSLAPGSYANFDQTGQDVHLSAGTYNFNCMTQNGNGVLVLDSGPVVINVTGNSCGTDVIKLNGGGISNAGLDPSQFTINYAGTGNVKLAGGNQAAALLYAPNASLSFSGGGEFYGAAIANNVTDFGGATINYDRRLQKSLFTVGNWMLDSFTWKKF